MSSAPPTTRAKTCGITTPEDARACHELGADYLGVIFAKSPRQVSCEAAAAIRRAVPDARLVGVFVDDDTENIVAVADDCNLDMIQLHGAEAPEYCAALQQQTALPVIKALRLKDLTVGNGLQAYQTVAAILLDLDKKQPEGSEGRLRLWDAAAQATREGLQIFLAGGLDPDNVRAAIDHAAPFAVDVCSGVERIPGIKDPRRVARFIAEVRACTQARP